MNLQACTINATLQLAKCAQIQSHFIHGSHWNVSINFNAYLTKFHHIQFVLCSFGTAPHFSHRSPWECVFPSQSQKRKAWDPKVNSSGFLISFPRQTNDQTDLEFLNLHKLTTTKISQCKSISFQPRPMFC